MHDHLLIPGSALTSYGQYLAWKGGNAIVKARELGPDAVLEELSRSGLRGRGGAGFPTGVKWRSLRNHPCATRYVVCNAAEGEPGTFKDRYLVRHNPYAVLEGVLIAAHVLGARDVYLVTKASFTRELARLRTAAQEIAAAGLLSYHEIHICEGPEEYLLGEEKALLEVVEGNGPLPRPADDPPYEHGLFATPASPNPALVNNAETFAHVPSIVRRGGESFRRLGTHDTPGSLLFTVSGDVARPGVYELPAGVTLRQVFYEVAGGPRPGRTFKAAISGTSSAVLLPDKFDTPADFASMALAGTGLGSAGFVVFDDATSMPRVAQALARFLYVESCNQCAACKHGLGIASKAIDEMFDPERVSPDHAQRAMYGARSAPQGNRCYLPVGGSLVVPSLLTRFASEFETQVAGRAAESLPYLVPKIVDYDEATHTFTYDEAQARKQPNWTFEPVAPAASPPAGHPPREPQRERSREIRLAPDVRAAVDAAAAESGRDAEQVVDEALRAWLAASKPARGAGG